MKKNNHGSTLVEVIVSIVIIAVIMAAVTITYSGFHKTMNRSKALTNMVKEASELIDEFTVTPNIEKFNVSEDPKKVYYSSSFIKTSDETNNYLEYVVSSSDDFHKITVTIYYDGSSIRSFSREVEVND